MIPTEKMSKRAINILRDTIFEEYLVDDYLWGYTDDLAVIIEKDTPGTFNDTTFGIFYGVRTKIYIFLKTLSMRPFHTSVLLEISVSHKVEWTL